MKNNLNQLEQQAVEWVNLVVKKQFEKAVEFFDKTMSEQVPPAKLQEIWNAIISQVGTFENVIGTRTSQMNDSALVFVTCKFGKAALDIQLTYNAEKKIAGLFFRPSSAAPNYSPPEYADADLFTETEVTIGTGKWLLPATLSMPKGEGPFSAIVLVHGSGPNDRDETVGANKPFKDLAWGLASRNIAVLRYEKRTKQYPQETAATINSLTVQEETIDDALAGVTLLAETKGIDTQRIYVLGHSLGAMLAPRIASQDGRIKGLIILAGLTRNLGDAILDQYNYLASLAGTPNTSVAVQIKAIEQQVKKIKELDIREGEVVMGAGKAYWEDLAEYNVIATAMSLAVPMFILQGERDYQVTMKDFNAWVDGLKEKKNITYKTYPDLNHLFISGTGKSTPSEYQQPGNVAKTVVDDITAWIESQH